MPNLLGLSNLSLYFTCLWLDILNLIFYLILQVREYVLKGDAINAKKASLHAGYFKIAGLFVGVGCITTMAVCYNII